jgi:four helix bundle protein
MNMSVNSYKDLIIWQRSMDMVEGYGRQSTGSYSQFLSVARGSLFELETQVEICIRLKYIHKTESGKLIAEIVEISKMISSLISKLH